MKGMKKFDIKEPEYSFYLNNQTTDWLFGIGNGGYDISIHKEQGKEISYCKQESFEYKGISNSLCEKFNFTPKRFIVIEMK
ncbi:hypothetical protein ENU1_145950 [Entamoeba nuttalli P19]|uniref:TLDc domain-containing protein n=1 Tax=Entamoeba nuttalli (strain P19) TaxID=1076696 RepID=K2GV32_ENTNP|nr:hypothetical protein ENU1_145950 [Entamoeba nuttalli P19]EKE38963.1 hypothetical protein ENU1_145950 [Entamoeba nuttalli P19]|eukprot:XP_008858700.1 hypothetical protein ENU1_145950 [Entamoeba nuttalli P19]